MSQFSQSAKLCALTAISLSAAFGQASRASAVAMISIDLDSTTPGIQDSRLVDASDVGTIFNVAVVIEDDVDSGFTTFNLGALFNNGTVPNVLGNVSNIRLGNIGPQTMISPNDINNGFAPVNDGDPLSTAALTPTMGFNDSLGQVSIINGGSLFSLTANTPTTLFLFDIELLAAGATDITAINDPASVAASSGIAGGTTSFDPMTGFNNAQLTVVPEPSTYLGTGFAVLLGGFGWYWHQRRLKKQSTSVG